MKFINNLIFKMTTNYNHIIEYHTLLEKKCRINIIEWEKKDFKKRVLNNNPLN